MPRYRAAHTGVKPGAPKVFAHFHTTIMNYSNEDLNTFYMHEVRGAMEMGVGFATNMFNSAQHFDVSNHLIAAANTLGAANFRFFFSADMSGSYTAADLITLMSGSQAADSHYYRINGFPVLSTYGGEALGDSWWQTNVLTPLTNAGHKVFFVPNFNLVNVNSTVPTVSAWTTNYNTYPSVDGLFDFASPGAPPFRTTDPGYGTNHFWSLLDAQESHCTAAHNVGKVAMLNVSPSLFYENHSVRQSIEWQGGRGMDKSWTSFFAAAAATDLIEMSTWNDWTESTYYQPTLNVSSVDPTCLNYSHRGHFELTKYYIAWITRRYKPTITADAVFVSHRTTPAAATATADVYQATIPWNSGQQYGAQTDMLYVTTAMTAAGEIRYNTGGTTGTIAVPAGITTTDIVFVAGTQSVEIWRNNVKLAGGITGFTPQNLALWSADFSNAAWGATTATKTASKLAETATTAVHTLNTTAAITVSAAVYTWSVEVQAAERTWICLFLNTAQCGTFFDLSAGAVGGSFAGVPDSSAILQLGGGWYRCIITKTFAGGTENPGLYLSADGASLVYAGTAGSGVNIRNAQFEQNGGFTVYVPTTTATVTSPVRGSTIISSPVTHNVNHNSCFYSSAGSNSLNWVPSDRWKTGFIADWFN